VADHLTNASRWSLTNDDVEITVGVVHTPAGPRVLLGLENVATSRPVTGRHAPIQADVHLTNSDVDVLIVRLVAVQRARAEAEDADSL
jgi:hypothetical protein